MRASGVWRLASGVVTAMLLLACDDDPAGLAGADLAGSYTATTFNTTTSGGTTTNQLDLGASLTIQLATDGTTTGHLTIPASSSTGGQAVDTDLAGTWALNGSVISFTDAADTFVRDMLFVVQGTTLVGDQTFSGTRVQVVLTRE
jgi:hypothetical protein